MARKIPKTGKNMAALSPAEEETRLDVRPGAEGEGQIDEEESMSIFPPLHETPDDVTSDLTLLMDEFMAEYRPVLAALAR